VSTNAYGKMMISFRPAFCTRRPNEDIVSPCAVSWTATTKKRPARKTRPPRPIFFATTNGVP
jgi:hypothetical protein